jgi:cysteine desulfurase
MIYFDNCSSTKTTQLSLDTYNREAENSFLNPGGSSKKAVQMGNKIVKRKKQILKSLELDSQKYQLITTSSATEANNMVIFTLLEKKNPVILTTPYEHSSVQVAVEYLKKHNNLIQLHLPLQKDKSVDYIKLVDMLETNNIDLVSLVHVDSEIGIKLDEQKMIKTIKTISNCPIHFDIVQSFSKLSSDFRNVDYLTISSHKIGSVKGIGALISNIKRPVKKLIFGGNQENNLRAGTENYPGLMSFTAQIIDNFNGIDEKFQRAIENRNLLINLLIQIPQIKINTPLQNSSPYIVNISVPGYPSSVVTSYLEQNNIFVSALSTCSSRQEAINNLSKLKFEPEIANSSFRICLNFNTTREEIYELVGVISKIPKELIRMD